jgi:Flp pilus assembly protein TadG
MTKPAARLGEDGGAAALEFALLLPVLLIILAVMMDAGRLWIARSDILAVARNASREAVLQPSASLAAATASSAGQDTATGYGLNLSRLSINPEGPFGPGANYRVQVSYVVNSGDLPGLGFLPGGITISTAATEPIDPNTAQ